MAIEIDTYSSYGDSGRQKLLREIHLKGFKLARLVAGKVQVPWGDEGLDITTFWQ